MLTEWKERTGMPNARERAAAKKRDKHLKRRQFHMDRVQQAPSLVQKLEAAFGLLRAELLNTSNAERATRIGNEVCAFMIDKSDEIPRSTA